MTQWLQGITLFLASFAAFALEPERSNTNAVTWEIYGAVAAVFIVGGVWVFFRIKKDKAREEALKRGTAGKS